MASEALISAWESYVEFHDEHFEEYREKNTVDSEMIDACIQACRVGFQEKDIEYALKMTKTTKKYINEAIFNSGNTFNNLEAWAQERKESVSLINWMYDVLLLESPYLVDSYKLYVERNRRKQDRFYEPRRKTLYQISEAIQDLEDDKLDILFLHQPPRTGKSGDLTLDTSWHISRDMEKSNLYVTYKEGLGGAFLTGVQEVLTDPTYAHKDVFPQAVIVDTDAKNNKLDLGRKKKYKTLSGKGLESGLNGEYDANGWLIIDDPLEGVQDVMSEDVLRRKQTIFDNNVMSRKKEKCKLVLMGTIWSLNDLFMNYLNFIEQDPKGMRYRIIKIPALDPETDESNFNYAYGVGFSTDYYQRTRLKHELNDDMAGWMAQYQQEPIERDGAVFTPDHMADYFEELPEGEPLKKIAHCDVALGGGDFLSFPILYCYEDGEIYCPDVVFDNEEKHITQPQVVSKIKKHELRNIHFESNQGGEGYKDDIKRLLEEQGYRDINIKSDYAPSTKRKEQRIWDNAEAIRRIHFLEPKMRHKQYQKFMQNLFSFTMVHSKRKHDDAADSLSGAIDFDRQGSGVATVQAIQNPFRRG